MKHTKGKWKINNGFILGEDGFSIATIDEIGIDPEWSEKGASHWGDSGFNRDIPEEEYEANAKLIAEAGTVANETGKTPRQLADSNAELLKAAINLTGSLEGLESSELESYQAMLRAIQKATNLNN